MNNEETLRTALSEIMHATHSLPCDGAPDAILLRIREVANRALNDTAGCPKAELDRLMKIAFCQEGDSEEQP